MSIAATPEQAIAAVRSAVADLEKLDHSLAKWLLSEHDRLDKALAALFERYQRVRDERDTARVEYKATTASVGQVFDEIAIVVGHSGAKGDVEGLMAKVRTMAAERDRWLERVKVLEARQERAARVLEGREP